jgi:ubiquinone/menaquinone biosynthesis C-methylase UbiE
MDLEEAEIQVLASVFGAESDKQPTDRVALESRGQERYWIFREDWSRAFDSLVNKALIDGDDDGYHLTEQSRSLAECYFKERPDYYWYFYQHFYDAANASEAHSQFCQRVYGLDLCQEGMTDMASVQLLIDKLTIQPGQQVADLGCGAGGISEWISDQTGTAVTGVDYSTVAIATAFSRTQSKRSRLHFVEADLNTLDLPDKSFDAAIVVDAIYWVDNEKDVLARIVKTLKPGGKLAILIVHLLEYCEAPEELEIDKTYIASALDDLKLNYQSFDLTDSFSRFWPRAKQTMLALKDDFEREGNGYICEHWLREANKEFLPALEADELRRYLYLVHT